MANFLQTLGPAKIPAVQLPLRLPQKLLRWRDRLFGQASTRSTPRDPAPANLGRARSPDVQQQTGSVSDNLKGTRLGSWAGIATSTERFLQGFVAPLVIQQTHTSVQSNSVKLSIFPQRPNWLFRFTFQTKLDNQLITSLHHTRQISSQYTKSYYHKVFTIAY